VLAVRDDGRILLQRRSDSGVWEIPAGASEPGDSFRSTAAREFAEEVGVSIDEQSLVPFASLSEPHEHTLRYPNGDIVHAFALCFFVHLDVRDLIGVTTDGEATEAGWFSTTELPESIHAPSRRVLQLYCDYLESQTFQAY
jgi:8-oxo-dGTP pyrophosphatase MutT (NUDIX family)